MSAEKIVGSWFRYYPEHYLWSQLMCGAINLASREGTSFYEVDQIGKRLQGKEGDGDAWHDAWLEMADKVLATAEAEEKKGHARTAAGAYIRSAIYRYTCERFVHPDDPRKADSYRKLLPAYEKGMKFRIPGFERVEVPYEEGPLPAWWIPPINPTGNDPAIAFFDGLDTSKEFTVLSGGLPLRERGIGVLCVDGPGQGETLRLMKIPSRPDYEAAGTAAFDYLDAREGVDSKRIGIMAVSMGGYYAPRIAAFEHRYAACLTWGAHFDYHEVWLHRRNVLEAGGTISSSAIWQLPWVLGRPDMDSAMEKCRDYTLEGVAEKIQIPICITHGQDDNIVPVDMAHRLFAACGSPEKELKIFTVEDGGSQHCVFDNMPMISGWIADWWMDRFGTSK
ncbi:alpha/beta hydrolase family protein [Nitrospinota bacterium]